MHNASEHSIEVAGRHQSHLERLKTGAVNDTQKFLADVDRSVSGRLAGKNITEFNKRRLNALLASVRADLAVINDEMAAHIKGQMLDLADYEAGFESRALGQTIKADFVLPTSDALHAAVMVNPLSVEGIGGGKLIEPFIKDLTGQQMAAVEGAIRQGYYQGETTNQILQKVRGTRAMKFKNGIVGGGMNRAMQMAVRTGLQHSAAQAREQVWERNAKYVKRVQWVSTLDGKTSATCRGLDGRTFEKGRGPRPPIHINCRSSTAPVLDKRFAGLEDGATRSARGEDGKVVRAPADESYYGWLKRQPEGFQDSIIGPTRTKLLNDGGLTAQRFQELQLGKSFKPITLKQMRELEPVAFERAGI